MTQSLARKLTPVVVALALVPYLGAACGLFADAATEVPLPNSEACLTAYEALFIALDRGYPLQTYVDAYGQPAVTCALAKFVEKYRGNPQFKHAVDRAVDGLSSQ